MTTTDYRYGHTQTLSHKTHRSPRADVFEYSIYGDHTGQSKIGNFTQSKLDGWAQ